MSNLIEQTLAWHDRDTFSRNKRKEVIHSLKPLLVLDGGCGTGWMSMAASKVGLQIIAVDISVETLAHLKDVLKRKKVDLELMGASLTHLPFRKDIFDSVICCDVLEHIPDTGLVLKELNRIIKRNGRLCITVPNGLTYGVVYDRVLLGLLGHFLDLYYKKRKRVMIETGRVHEHMFVAESLRSFIERSNFRINKFKNLAFLGQYLTTLKALVEDSSIGNLIEMFVRTDFEKAKYVPVNIGSEWLIVCEKG